MTPPRITAAALAGLAALSFAISGCGEKTVVGPGAASKLEESQECIRCHDGNSTGKVASKVTGKLISEEWMLSGHNTKNGASCGDCHEPYAGHPNSCNRCHGMPPSGTAAVHDVTINADAAGKCAKCHTKNGGFGVTTVGNITVNSLQVHFNSNTSANYPSSYVSSQYENNCRKCHNPHDTATALPQAKDWAVSGHGTAVEGVFGEFRTATRDSADFKTAGSFTLKASQALSDSTNGNNQVCIRCHTTTGYINYVSTGFSDLSPFGSAIDPATGKPYRLDDYKSGPRSKISKDFSKELTNCDACHDNGKGTAYGYQLRTVSRVTSYYNYSSKSGSTMRGLADNTISGPSAGGAIRGFGLTFPDVGASNICVACHSGRMTGIDIYLADVRGLAVENASRIVPHFRGAAELIFRPIDKNGTIVGAGFEFYSSGSSKPQNYANVSFTHNIIGTPSSNAGYVATNAGSASKNMVADQRGYGPCIGCHMNANGKDGTSHTFLPVNREASSTYLPGTLADGSTPITTVTSKACAACHTDSGGVMEWDVSGVDAATGASYNNLEIQKRQFQAAAKAFARLLAFALDIRKPTAADIANPLSPTNTSSSAGRVWIDSEGRPGTPSNWYGLSTSTGAVVSNAAAPQKWLRSQTSSSTAWANADLPFYVTGAEFIDPLTGGKYKVRSTAYTMGAAFNFYMLYYDPGAFAHNRRYVKRLIFDSMDWLDNGKLDKSVCDPAITYTRAGDSRNRQYPSLNTYGGTGIAGANDFFRYSTYLTPDELKQASFYLCGSTVASNNADGSIKSYTSDHRPAP